jgi:putative intracellular protease/amidase
MMASKCGVSYASAGCAALIKYHTATNLQKIASQVYAECGIVSSVCHGPAIFTKVPDLQIKTSGPGQNHHWLHDRG